MCRRWDIFDKISSMRLDRLYKWSVVVLLSFWAGRGYGQAGTGIAVPEGSKLLLHVYGKGVQLYVCAPMAGDSSTYVWAPMGARAALYSKEDKQVGKHYFNAEHSPVWELADGAKVVGKKLAQQDAPVAGAVPWLLLQAVSAPDNGVFKGAALIQRINTKGGKAPGNGADAAHKGQTLEVEYSAEYLFYAAAD